MKKNNINNPLWLDLVEHIIKEKTHKNFLSKNILYNKDVNINEVIYILSVTDLPIDSLEHEYKRTNNSNLTSITTKSNIILFKKEIAEAPLNINNKLLISQRINDIDYKEDNIDINNCSINIKYAYQAIVTNISNKSLNFQLFIQIPQGAIGIKSTYYTNSLQIELKPYETKEYKLYFYFPKEGTFYQYYPVASQNNVIISIGNSLVYKVKKEYFPIQKIESYENNSKYSKDMKIEGKLRNILADGSISSEDKLPKILNYFKKDIFDKEDIINILYLLKNNKKFFLEIINTLRNRGYYDENIWSFAFLHKDEKSIKEYLSVNKDLIQDLGYDFKSTLYSYNEINDAIIHPHLEYSPIYNARKHPFGKDKDNENKIVNIQFKETYEQFIIDLLPLQTLRIKEKLQLTYYLIIQDRMEEALNIFNQIKKEELNDNNNQSFKIQYDYIYAYLDFTFGYPDFKIAKSVCKYYKEFPLMHWRQRFEEIEDELLEYENKENLENIENKDDIEMNVVEEDKYKKSLIQELKEKEPKLSFNIENKEGKIVLLHSNISEINIKFYFIDLEIIFTREPKISEIINKTIDNNNDKNNYIKEQFGFVQANYSETIKIPDSKNNKGTNSTIYQIPEVYRKKNLLVEINYESIKYLDLYLSSNLYVIITESLGELQVLDEHLKPLIKSYVKVYAKLSSNDVQFYKDGYSDLNGKFNYLALNTDQLKNATKFYIYVSEMNHGDTIKECFPPKNIDNLSNDDIPKDINISRSRSSSSNRSRSRSRRDKNLYMLLNRKRKGPPFVDIFNEKK